jgi:glycine/D-amino acid oxidase-like deaminating enzyme
MSNSDSLTKKIERGLFQAARASARLSYPLRWEKLEIDENRSLWASYTPEYRSNAGLTGSETADLCIIGGGYTGISTAYHFSQRYPEKRVVLLEAKSLANGASGRNGGMMLNWVYGVGPMSDEMTARVYQATNQTIDSIEQIIQEHNLDVSYRRDGCFEVFTDEQRAIEAKAEVAHLNSIGVPVQFWDAAQVRQKINLNGIYGGLFEPN